MACHRANGSEVKPPPLCGSWASPLCPAPLAPRAPLDFFLNLCLPPWGVSDKFSRSRPILRLGRPKTNVERSVLRLGRPKTNVERSVLRLGRSKTNVERSVLRSGLPKVNVERSVLRSWCPEHWVSRWRRVVHRRRGAASASSLATPSGQAGDQAGAEDRQASTYRASASAGGSEALATVLCGASTG